MKTVIIEHLDNAGNGCTQLNDQSYIVPFALPGEKIAVIKAELVKKGVHHVIQYDRLTNSPNRQPAPCPYFGSCGGCQLQHLNQSAYLDFKVKILWTAFESHNIKIPESLKRHSIKAFGPGVRRRINFKISKTDERILLGYHQRRSHRILDITECMILTPDIQDLIAPLKGYLNKILKPSEKFNLFLTQVTKGFDVVLDYPTHKEFTSQQMDFLTQMAKENKLLRITLQTPLTSELLYQSTQPTVDFLNHPMTIPPNPFLQPSQESQDHMIETVLGLVPSSVNKIADLFCGLGTFTLPLAQYAPIDAFEENDLAIKNLTQQKNAQPYVIHPKKRDLFKNPLSVDELASYDLVVIDPPRAGAVRQIKNMADSQVPHIIMISCNAHTFARDIHLLIKCGYILKKLQIFDQFLWSVHLEMIAFLERD